MRGKKREKSRVRERRVNILLSFDLWIKPGCLYISSKKSSPLPTLSLAFNSSLLAQTKWSFHFLPGLPGPQVVVSSVALRACKVHSSSSELSSIITELTVAFPVWSCLAWVMLRLNPPPDKYSPVWRRSGNQRLILPVAHCTPTRWSNYNTHTHSHTHTHSSCCA